MRYRVEWTKDAEDDLRELPEKVSNSIVKKVETYLAQDPKGLGQALCGQFSGLFRYRIGDYRIIYHINHQTIFISVTRVCHRKDVYDL